MVEVSPCRGCDNEYQSKDKHPDCVRCIAEGVPGKYAKRIDGRDTNDPEVVVKGRNQGSEAGKVKTFEEMLEMDKKIQEEHGFRELPYGSVSQEDEVKKYIKRKCQENGISFEILVKRKRSKAVLLGRRNIALGLRKKFDLKDSEIAKALEITPSAVWHIFKYKKKSGQSEVHQDEDHQEAAHQEAAHQAEEVKKYIKRMCRVDGITIGDLMQNKTSRSVSWTRRKVIGGLIEEFNLKSIDIAKTLKVHHSSVNYQVMRIEIESKKEAGDGAGEEKKIEEEQSIETKKVDYFPGKKLFYKLDPDTIGKDGTLFDFKDITIGQLLSRREGLIDRVIKEAECDLRTPEDQVLFYIWQGVEKGCR